MMVMNNIQIALEVFLTHIQCGVHERTIMDTLQDTYLQSHKKIVNDRFAVSVAYTFESNKLISRNETQFHYYSIQLMSDTIHLHFTCDR